MEQACIKPAVTRHREKPEVADVFRKYEREFFEQYGSSLSTDQRRAFDAIVACRTNALGGHIEQCDQCGHERNAYNSCLMGSSWLWGVTDAPRSREAQIVEFLAPSIPSVLYIKAGQRRRLLPGLPRPTRAQWALVGAATVSAFGGALLGRRLLPKMTVGKVRLITGCLLLLIGFGMATGLMPGASATRSEPGAPQFSGKESFQGDVISIV